MWRVTSDAGHPGRIRALPPNATRLERGCVQSASRSTLKSFAASGVFQQASLAKRLRLVPLCGTQPRSGDNVKLRPPGFARAAGGKSLISNPNPNAPWFVNHSRFGPSDFFGPGLRTSNFRMILPTPPGNRCFRRQGAVKMHP
jgi:hypothetical protein